MSSKQIDYTLYLVTDSTPEILQGKPLVSVVQDAILGGVTIVQLRDKTSNTADLVRMARELHVVTRAAGVPLLINDRVDVALAAGVEGVHIGQDDMDLGAARRLLGPLAIIGVTVNDSHQALKAAREGADYLGIGTVFTTDTKKDAKSVIGISGVREILTRLSDENFDTAAVCIGGISTHNIQRVLYQSACPAKRLSGVAVVSAIIAAPQPRGAAQCLRNLIGSAAPFAPKAEILESSLETITNGIPNLVQRLAKQKPLCHNMTNLVVQNFAANVALAVGSSPIMSNDGQEATDLAALGGSLVINMGTATAEIRQAHLDALAAYNAVGRPVLLDPVGAGATKIRREGVKALLGGGYFDVIKGNESEILTVAGSSYAKQHGVDAGVSRLTLAQKAQLVKDLAARERNVILMTGHTDIVSDGRRTIAISNGDEMLGEITGSGCTLGTTIASFLAIEREDRLLATIAGVLMYEVAAERAMARGVVRGPGSFIPAFLDELFLIRCESAEGMDSWVKAAKIQIM